ncbi:MAG TPA: MaoC family dehydratase N-terminal domain-containing protein [Dongiaceae bacterium]|jgi:acyl dehydratase
MGDGSEIDRSLIGSAMTPFTVEVEKGAIRRFAEAIGETTAIYFDEAFARSLGYSGIVAPPTFPTAFRPPSEPAWRHGLDEGRILAGEQGFRYRRPIYAGDRLQCEFRLTDVQDKRSSKGSMELMIQDLIITSTSGDMVCVNRRVVIYRGRTVTFAQGASP